VFTVVFSIVENDMGHRLKFQHIDDEGIQKIVADAHEGQEKDNSNLVHYNRLVIATSSRSLTLRANKHAFYFIDL